MQVKTLLKIVDCKIELFSGHGRKAQKVPPCRIDKHLQEEVTKIFPRGSKLVICSEIPDYELDVDVDVDEIPTEDDLPWD